jgi:hypothetical protein
MQQARLAVDGIARWVKICFCATPLAGRPFPSSLTRQMG